MERGTIGIREAGAPRVAVFPALLREGATTAAPRGQSLPTFQNTDRLIHTTGAVLPWEAIQARRPLLGREGGPAAPSAVAGRLTRQGLE